MGYLSVMTNCALIALAFDIRSWKIFLQLSDVQFFLVIVAAEHILIFVKMFFNQVISNVPYWVTISVARHNFKADMVFKKEVIISNPQLKPSITFTLNVSKFFHIITSTATA
jgi:anoctamin-10